MSNKQNDQIIDNFMENYPEITSILNKLHWFYNLDLSQTENSKDYLKTLSKLKEELLKI